MLIEPINPRDRPDYFLARVEHAADIIAKVERPNVRIQFDFYHAQIVGGDLMRRQRLALGLPEHVQDRPPGLAMREQRHPLIGHDALGPDCAWMRLGIEQHHGSVQVRELAQLGLDLFLEGEYLARDSCPAFLQGREGVFVAVVVHVATAL